MSGREPALPIDALLAEGLDWVRRSEIDGLDDVGRRALIAWRERGPGHDAAYREAQVISGLARAVSREILAERIATGETVVPFRRPAPISRRAFIGTAMAASIAGVLTIGNSLDLLPSLGPRPDLMTGKGQRKTISLARGLRMTLDAETRANVTATGGHHRIELLGGRAEVEARLAASQQVTLVAARGQIQAVQARYDIRLDGDRGCVSCLEGEVRVAYDDRRVGLAASQQLVYSDETIASPIAIDPDIVSAWRSGLLVYHDTPLADVVRDVNRYRDGRIVISREAIAQHPVSGVFHIDRMGQAVDQIEQITGARATALPGGVVILT